MHGQENIKLINTCILDIYCPIWKFSVIFFNVYGKQPTVVAAIFVDAIPNLFIPNLSTFSII